MHPGLGFQCRRLSTINCSLLISLSSVRSKQWFGPSIRSSRVVFFQPQFSLLQHPCATFGGGNISRFFGLGHRWWSIGRRYGDWRASSFQAWFTYSGSASLLVSTVVIGLSSSMVALALMFKGGWRRQLPKGTASLLVPRSFANSAWAWALFGLGFGHGFVWFMFSSAASPSLLCKGKEKF